MGVGGIRAQRGQGRVWTARSGASRAADDFDVRRQGAVVVARLINPSYLHLEVGRPTSSALLRPPATSLLGATNGASGVRDHPDLPLSQRFEALCRTPALIAAVQSEEELAALLSSTLRSLYRNLLRCGLYVSDERRELVPLLGRGEDRRAHEEILSAWSRSRRAADQPRGGLPGSRVFRAPRGGGRGPLMSAPMFDAGSMIGLIVVEGAPPTSDFTFLDLQLLEGVAALLSLATQRLRSKQAEGVDVSVALDRKSAMRVQRGLMSGSLPTGVGVTVDAKYVPAFDVGGDFYELTCLGDGDIAAVIGDVSGKGVSAALIMSRVTYDLRRALRSGVGPSAVLGKVNAAMTDFDSETFVTASCIRIDTSRRRLTVANAGHLPLLVRRASGEVFTFGAPSGTPLGMLPCDYVDEEVALEPLDIVLLMTDGLIDALDRPSDCMGEGLLRLVKSAPHNPKSINAHILEVAKGMKAGKLPDDMTLVALQLAG